MTKLDIIIKNADIVDGSGSERYRSDVAVKDGKIVKISETIDEPAEITINAEGRILSPGFIDPHAHNDGYIFLEPSNIYKLAQGVTTEISGNCGEGMVPVSDEFFDEIYEYYRPYYPQEDFRTYKTGKIFYGKVAELPLGNNVAFHCAHGTLRMNAMGFANRKATEEELNTMKEKLAECLEAGALGMSSGLCYSPGCFADTEELIELCKVVKKYDGIYATHIRSESFTLIDSIKEAIEIARQSGVRTVISHLKAQGRHFWGMSADILKLIEDAQSEGLEVYCDQYPYTYSCTVLHWVLPMEYTEGGFAVMCQRLKDPAERQKIKDMYDNKFGSWDNLMENITPEGIHILKADRTPNAVGKALQEYAELINNDPYETMFDVIIENDADVIAAFDCISEEDICRIMQKDYCMAGTDGIDVKPEEKSHPRLTGTFPRILGKYVREDKVLSLEKAVKKMTSLPAYVMKLKNKGQIKEGFDADLCIFDEMTIRDQGTLDNFNIKPSGIDYVIVNGKIAVENGEYKGTASGRWISSDYRRK